MKQFFLPFEGIFVTGVRNPGLDQKAAPAFTQPTCFSTAGKASAFPQVCVHKSAHVGGIRGIQNMLDFSYSPPDSLQLYLRDAFHGAFALRPDFGSTWQIAKKAGSSTRGFPPADGRWKYSYPAQTRRSLLNH